MTELWARTSVKGVLSPSAGLLFRDETRTFMPKARHNSAIRLPRVELLVYRFCFVFGEVTYQQSHSQ